MVYMLLLLQSLPDPFCTLVIDSLQTQSIYDTVLDYCDLFYISYLLCYIYKFLEGFSFYGRMYVIDLTISLPPL